MRNGVEEMEIQLHKLGFQTERPMQGMVAFPFIIRHGRFRGKEVWIALDAQQFPNIPPHGPYFKPQLIKESGRPHPMGGIHYQNKPSPQWEHWSRPIKDWNNTEKTMKVYLAHIQSILDFE